MSVARTRSWLACAAGYGRGRTHESSGGIPAPATSASRAAAAGSIVNSARNDASIRSRLRSASSSPPMPGSLLVRLRHEAQAPLHRHQRRDVDRVARLVHQVMPLRSVQAQDLRPHPQDAQLHIHPPQHRAVIAQRLPGRRIQERLPVMQVIVRAVNQLLRLTLEHVQPAELLLPPGVVISLSHRSIVPRNATTRLPNARERSASGQPAAAPSGAAGLTACSGRLQLGRHIPYVVGRCGQRRVGQIVGRGRPSEPSRYAAAWPGPEERSGTRSASARRSITAACLVSSRPNLPVSRNRFCWPSAHSLHPAASLVLAAAERVGDLSQRRAGLQCLVQLVVPLVVPDDVLVERDALQVLGGAQRLRPAGAEPGLRNFICRIRTPADNSSALDARFLH